MKHTDNDHQRGPMNSLTFNDEGFSIIEILIAIMIFSIGVMYIASMQSHALVGSQKSRKLSTVTEKAVAVLEELVSLPYSHKNLAPVTVTPAMDVDGIDNDDDGLIDEAGETGDYSLTWTVLDAAPFSNSKTISVTLSSAVSNKQITLSGVVAKN